VEKYPTITFKSTRIEAAGSHRYRVTGDLTIRGVTKPVTLDVTEEGQGKDPWGGERAGFSASGTVDRSEFGLNWNQALELGGWLVGNEIKLVLEVELVRQD
jgi:polyisoprenoid-binding protein YceI